MKLTHLPNMITLLRILLIPFFSALLLYHMYLSALYVFIIAGLSDTLDGLVARRLSLRSEIGGFLDPLADKLLVVTSFVIFTYSEWVPVWLTVTVLSRDLFILIGWILLFLLSGKKSVQPSFAGKVANGSQMFLIAYILLDRTVPVILPGKDALIWLTAAFTVLSGLHYIYRGLLHETSP